MTRATAGDVRELAVLHTACKVLALRDEPRAEFTAWTPRGLNATPAKRGLFDTTWLALLARRCECSHVDDSTRHQAIDEMIARLLARLESATATTRETAKTTSASAPSPPEAAATVSTTGPYRKH